MSTYQDIDIYGRDNADGSPVMYYDELAIKNALYQWITSKKGDYLMAPTEGGALDEFQFKKMSEDQFFKLRTRLMSSITNRFSPAIDVSSITVTPDYERKITIVEIVYIIVSEGIVDTLEVYLNAEYSNKGFNYEEITYTEFNLYEFCRIKKPDQTSARLIYDYEFNKWKWGKYKLVNLLPTDSYFSDILLLCNGS